MRIYYFPQPDVDCLIDTKPEEMEKLVNCLLGAVGDRQPRPLLAVPVNDGNTSMIRYYYYFSSGQSDADNPIAAFIVYVRRSRRIENSRIMEENAAYGHPTKATRDALKSNDIIENATWEDMQMIREEIHKLREISIEPYDCTNMDDMELEEM